MNRPLYDFWIERGWIAPGPGLAWTRRGTLACARDILLLTEIFFEGGSATPAQRRDLHARDLLPDSFLPPPEVVAPPAAAPKRSRRGGQKTARKHRRAANRPRSATQLCLPRIAPRQDEEDYRVITAHARGMVLGQGILDADGTWSCRTYSGTQAAFATAEKARHWLRIKCAPCAFLLTRDRPGHVR